MKMQNIEFIEGNGIKRIQAYSVNKRCRYKQCAKGKFIAAH